MPPADANMRFNLSILGYLHSIDLLTARGVEMEELSKSLAQGEFSV